MSVQQIHAYRRGARPGDYRPDWHSVPEQIEKASRLINHRDRLLAQAKVEAKSIVELARSERGN